ncbi:DUF3078 domain-containing protein [candidate division KSB1 bacterium]|nr:DUF3078 domain-containing protein [candidate division KSB1 bacterium]
MMHTRFIFLMLLPMLGFAIAQDDKETPTEYGWKNEMIGSLHLSQSTFDNWAQGGEDNVAWQINLTARFENDQEKTNWTNSGKFSFGHIKIGDNSSKKSVDEIGVESVLTYKIGKYLNPYSAVTGRTQLTAGYDYSTDPQIEISNLFDPAYFTQSIGIGYKPSEMLQTRMGAAIKETLTRDHSRYADDPDTVDKIEKNRIEFGLESVTDLHKKIAENILLTTKLELFSNLEGTKEIDIRWDSLFSSKISKYIDVNFNVQFFYDRDISKKRQIKQALSLGLFYNFLK